MPGLPAWSASSPVHHPAQLPALERAATVLHTPCGDGTVCWHGWGPVQGRPLVLLHGGSGSWTHWVRNIAPLVQAGYRLLVPDMPGFGASAPLPSGIDADDVFPWLERGLNLLLGRQAVDLVGFSFGGLVAGLWTAAVPQRVSRLVLVGAPALSREQLPPMDLRVWQGLPPGPERDALHRHNLRVLMLAHDQSIDSLALVLHGENVVRDRLRKRRLMRTDILRQKLPTMRCTVHGIWGADDPLTLHRPTLVAQTLPLAPGFGSLVQIPRAGHWVQYEAAEVFNATLLPLLRDDGRPWPGH